MENRAIVQRDAFEWVSRLMAKMSPDLSAAREKSLDKVHWAAPTGMRYMKPDAALPGIDRAVVQLLDGQRFHGRLGRFNPAGIALKLRLQINGEPLNVAHTQIKRLTLTEPVAMIETASPRPNAMSPRTVVDFHIQFADGEIWEGETKGAIDAPSGVFLYTMEGEYSKHVGAARQNVARHFVPRSAIRSARIGRPSSTVAGRALVAAAPPLEYHAAASAPRVLEPVMPQALELLCKGQAANIDGLRLGDALKQLGIVTEEEVQAAITLQTQRRDGKRIGAILMEMKQLKEETIQQALLHRLGVPFVILRKLKANCGVVARLDRAECLARACAVLHETEKTAYLAMANPMDEETIKACRFRLEKRIEIVIADRADIAAFLLRHRVHSSQGLSPEYFQDWGNTPA